MLYVVVNAWRHVEMMKSGAVSTLLRSIIREIRLIANETGPKRQIPWREVYAYNALKTEFKALQHSESQQDTENSIFAAETYLCYLEGIRRGKELEAIYKGKGERSIEDSAARVGLKLPKKYEE